MKSLSPSIRENKRYMILNGKNLPENVERAILEFSGVLGMSEMGIVWISSNKLKDSAIIGVNRESLDLARACFSVYHEKIEVTKVSGTLKGLN